MTLKLLVPLPLKPGFTSEDRVS